MKVVRANKNDLASIQEAYASGRTRQQDRGTLIWPEFSDSLLREEVQAQKLFCVLDGMTVASTFAIAYNDHAVWGHHERNAHLYLHRIARGPASTSRGLLTCILDWACERCLMLGREGIRMDTAAASSQLIAYYEQAGFNVIGQRVIEPEPTLPSHYFGTEVALLEMKCTF